MKRLLVFAATAILALKPLVVAAAAEDAVTLKPYRVFAEMMELRPLVDRKAGSLATGLLVVNVTPKSAAARVGLRRGMIVTSIQGLAIAGLTEPEILAKTALLAPTRHHTFIVTAKEASWSLYQKEFEILLPGAKPVPTRLQRLDPADMVSHAVPPKPAPLQVNLLLAGLQALEDEIGAAEVRIVFQSKNKSLRPEHKYPESFVINLWDGAQPGALLATFPATPYFDSDKYERFAVVFTLPARESKKGDVARFRLTAEGLGIHGHEAGAWGLLDAHISVKSVGKLLIVDQVMKSDFVTLRELGYERR